MVAEATGSKARFAAMSFTMHKGAILVVTPVGLEILGNAQWGLFSWISKVILTYSVLNVTVFNITISVRDFYEKTNRKKLFN